MRQRKSPWWANKTNGRPHGSWGRIKIVLLEHAMYEADTRRDNRMGRFGSFKKVVHVIHERRLYNQLHQPTKGTLEAWTTPSQELYMGVLWEHSRKGANYGRFTLHHVHPALVGLE